ncbi:glycoside hydrolase family 13 protein [Jatrophihabitans endophyticus]|uniref:glycoside hydrolase family 13 protein n=1 Tax=Jatrophihabitans endophyticus TaxID=1206085 RepID=UPI0019D99C5D|nr:glycoside hydrolase family 13 protein [Jatrophihabitans endophyticus]MBE7187614.1 glycoside hydrolase family 13 protein [Jatrophihabitans endophyticus]
MTQPPESDAVAGISGESTPWWASGVFYQIYPRSFADGNGDGTGDLIGVRERLGHLVELGIDAIWLSPFYRSPMADGGYDVADPTDVDPMFGTLDDFDALVADAHARGIKVTVDLVPNHFSEQHPWFQAVLAGGPDAPERAYFVIRPGRGPDGAQPPNNWPSAFGGPAWSRLPDGDWYLHLFAPEQPDLDWTNPAVPAEFDRVMRFWLDRGVDGFRVDVANSMAKEPGLPDMDLSVLNTTPGATLSDVRDLRWDRDMVHEYLRGMRRTLDAYPGERMAIGEAWVADADRLARYARPDELSLMFNFELAAAPWGAADFRTAVESSLSAMRRVQAVCSWVLSNHDVERAATRYGGGARGVARARAAALLQLALPGAVYLYNGDELGLQNVDLPDDVLQDPTWERSGHTERGRDGERVPLPWSGDAQPYGFTTGTSTWLPMPDDWAAVTVEAEAADPQSTLAMFRAALRERRAFASVPDFTWLDAPDGCLALRRGEVSLLLNASDGPVPLDGTVLLASGPLTDDGTLPPDTAAWLT